MITLRIFGTEMCRGRIKNMMCIILRCNKNDHFTDLRDWNVSWSIKTMIGILRCNKNDHFTDLRDWNVLWSNK